ncbi:MAG: DMT family transporter [Actinobacteria bacterium]|nr:DMT family transporter [Actinomycetota bacterium]
MLISFSAVWVRIADIEPARSAFLRNAYALPIFAALIWWRQRSVGKRRSPRAGIVAFATIAGVFLGMDFIVWHESVAIIGAGLGTMLPNVQVVFVSIIAIFAFGERPHVAFWGALVPVLVGVWILGVGGEPIAAGGSMLVGVGLGVLAGLFYAIYLIVLRHARLRRPAARSVEVIASATLGAAILTGVFALLQGVAGPAVTPADNGWMLAYAFGSQVLGWLLITSSVHLLPASITAVALLLQPVLAMVWGATLLGEPIGAVEVGGAATVLFGVVAAHRAVVVGQRRERAAIEDEPAG